MIGDIIHIMVLAGIVISAIMVIWQKELISAAVALGACSLLLSLEFFILGAPDVAIAEAGVGAALTTAIYIMAIKETIKKGGDRE
jgi:uncharacterized MnhB-related membrane protein